MAADKQGGSTDLTPEEMRSWYDEEMRNVRKECELRVRDATEFTTAYLEEKLTPQQATKRIRRYEERWGDSLGGVYASSYQDDAAIVKAIDKLNRELEKARTYEERVATRPTSTGLRR